MSAATVRKERLEFKSGGTACVGYLYCNSTEIPKPCVIMGAGFGGTQDTPSMVAVATAFAQAGFTPSPSTTATWVKAKVRLDNW